MLASAWERVRTMWIPTNRDRLAQAEAAMLKEIESHVHTEDIATGDGHTIHTIVVQHADTKDNTAPIVLMHGFAMGAASWCKNLDAMAALAGTVYSIDWPGCGLSSNPRFPLRSGPDTCETFFVERLEAWRRSLGIERMVLVGHSFGGYFCACYAMQYPQHVEKLLLASPVGLGEKEFDSPFLNPIARAMLPWHQRVLINLVQYAWEASLTPQSIVRLLGPFGRKPVARYVLNRFAKARAAGTQLIDDTAMTDYLHQLYAQPGCGEYCLGEILNFGICAKKPLAVRFAEKFRRLGADAPPVVLLYGEWDWMNKDMGLWLAPQLAQRAEVLMVQGAGHQLFVEHPRGFNATAKRALLGHGTDMPDMVPGLYRQLWPHHSTL